MGLLAWLALCFGAAWFGSLFAPGEWYESLVKPWWTPPNWIFGPVWALLYVLMAVAAWLVWRAHGFSGAPVALGLFVGQLALNAAWSWLFFGLERPALALVGLVALWGALGGTMVAFWRLQALAGLLLAPYIIWVSFAAALNYALWRLNT